MEKNYFLVFEELGSLSRWVVLCSLQEGLRGESQGCSQLHGASGCFSAAPSFSAVPNVVWGGLCNRVSLQSQRVSLMHRDGRDSLHGGSMQTQSSSLCLGFPRHHSQLWIFKPSESQKGRPQIIIIGCVFYRLPSLVLNISVSICASPSAAVV